MKRKSLLVLLTLVLAFGSVLAACGSDNSNEGSQSGEGNAPAEQVLNINLSAEPPTFDPAQAQDSQTNTVLKLMYEGLVRMGEDGNPVPGVAESWEISEDGKEYVFTLREDAKWSNGDAVTANDFVFAWKRVLDPASTPAPPYAYQLYYIENAEQFNTGEITDFSQVGVEAVDEKTLKVKLVNPTPYFLGLTSFYTYYPVHSSVDGNDKWATNKDSMVVNGPFTLTEWTTGQKIQVTKNEQYWDKASINLARVDMSLTNSGATELSSYRNGEIDYAGAPNGEIPTDQIKGVQSELPDEFNVKGIASTYYYMFNVTAEPFQNAKIRKAFAMSINRQAIVDNVTLGGQLPAFGFVPPGIKGASEEFRTEVEDAYFEENAEEAKRLLEEGMKEEGYTTLPKVTLIYNSSEAHQKLAVAVADMWKNVLGVEVATQNQEWGVFLETRKNLNYQVARAGWSADYNDPMTFMDMWTTGNGNNDSGYANPEYDALIKQAAVEQDTAKRNDLFAQAEKMLVEEDMVIAPLYYYTNVSLTKPYLKGVSLDFSGAIDFTRASVEGK
ncbi:peptide ABC transporter substrate-binding protein [Paenibacillus urinalis]|uniref:Peptide ABC transporter substrate-binding protein n=1 Tax=Paenibacillus urinalis TaxID=521520 RepID=A0ABY7X8R3_9BACL|nr:MULTISPECIES: peptide ABC transporter substrate-binding protein [Paenibacillus]WDH97585.1 peptide ABC transporter substrate-binding protein [Paenibacillus urinalis]WDI01255.1 peptide ABC transporter substrate-binding protein [Paenibacillus urinalis]GAK39680.1 oligopeptide ABC transporter oligopeptide-binding protein [Paenibacillus sp. TCA20]